MQLLDSQEVVTVTQMRRLLPNALETRVPALTAFADGNLLVAFDTRLAPTDSDWEAVGGAMAADLPNPNSLGLVRGSVKGNELVFSAPKIWKQGSTQPKTGFSDPCILSAGNRVVVVYAKSTDVGFAGSRGYRGQEARNTLFIEVAVSDDRGETWSYADTSATVYGDYAGVFATSGHGVVISYEFGDTWVVPLVARRFDGSTTHLTMRSADRGLSWVVGEPTGADMDETAYGLLDGKLVLSARRTSAFKSGELGRYTAVSEDGGLTWSVPQWDDSLPAAACNASLLSVDRGLLFAYSGAGRKGGFLALKSKLSAPWEEIGCFTTGPCGYVETAWVAGKLLVLYEVPTGIRASLLAL
ncbi:glycoside hydrolase [Gleimia sp. 6138-11-ORH1]|uniref:sialidase family protein n=1 Tax=Gleimia sp. 6138-11-ORH1 TaxID=2973937 RepID=UPI002167C0DB|nr:sialidase family protein [Gleimia sp. 6138-11-ORH1]MCS4484312.1 glycoside hydrolase [Gleimia sp. 6138-11-ORH1]